MAVDEAHRLKNNESKLGGALRSLKYDRLLLLTGTPIQNNTEELFTLMNHLNPQEFSSAEDFLKEFGKLENSTQINKLHTILKSYLVTKPTLLLFFHKCQKKKL